MPDIVDRAQVNEELLRREAFHRRRYGMEVARAEEDPFYIDGRRCCLDCEEPIPEARLRVNPGATRCMKCQGMKERRG
jgi:phage/conjugal plasmid C-4 type zinc finger TraR family protein